MERLSSCLGGGGDKLVPKYDIAAVRGGTAMLAPLLVNLSTPKCMRRMVGDEWNIRNKNSLLVGTYRMR